MKNNEKSIKINYIYNLTYQILSIITPLITAPYLSRVLKADGIGEYSYTGSLVAYFIMVAALGTLNYGNREISYLQNDRKKRTKVFWEIELLSMASVAVVLCAYFVFLIFYKEHRTLLLIQSLCLISVAMDIAWLLQGLEEFGKVIGRNIFFKVVNIAFIFIAIKSKEDLLLYVLGMCVMELLSNMSIWLYVPKFVDRPVLRELRPFSHLKATCSLFVPTIATTIYTMMDKTMLGLFSDGCYENGYYEQATKLSKMTLTIVTALGTVMIPRIGKYFGEGKEEKVKDLLYESFRFVWFMGLPLCFGLMGVSYNFVPWFYGEGFEPISDLLIILALLIPIIGISNVIGIQYLITTRREKLLSKSVFAGAVVNMMLNCALIPFFYSNGAAVASVIAELVITIMQLWYVRKELSIRKIFYMSRNYIISSIAMLPVLYLENGLLTSNIINTICMIASGFLIYIGILLLLKDKFLMKLLKTIEAKIKK